ncbi:hypothetical protein ASPCAL02166 [Aspergillus calidoustus]|uniref:Branched-chain amino acid aminotransferase n=1 Tax=Aspergillus calidoustus TaxID=454130 RepID=A0A0U5GJZ3_ASPCI|nr:hypothetical protein ASPCAL02166 [Aspergillus calidoustus]
MIFGSIRNFLIGDDIWEEIHASNGRIQLAKDHIDRLFQSAKAMFMDLGVSETQLQDLLHKTLDENNMSNEPHVHTRWW